MVARLVRIRMEHAAVTRGAPWPDAASARATHAARHARAVESPAAPRPTPLSIRSAERRRWSAELTRPGVTALVLHGMGGVGKSTLATQIASRVSRLEPERVVTALSGETPATSLAAEAADADLVVLDDFGDNLAGQERPLTVRDPALAALLVGWTGKLLISCDTPFSLPEAGPGRFVFRRLGPLTRSGAGELALSLPALRQLAEPQREVAWRLTGGHPRAMEHLDAVLANGARFEDLADRVAMAVQDATGRWSAGTSSRPSCPRPAAEVVAVAACEYPLGELLSCLSAGAPGISSCGRPCSARRSSPVSSPPAPRTSPSARRPGCSRRARAISFPSTAGPRASCTAAWPRWDRLRSWPRRTGRPLRTGRPVSGCRSSARARSSRPATTCDRPPT